MPSNDNPKNGKRNGDGRADGPSTYEDSVVAYDEALSSGSTTPDQKTEDPSLDPARASAWNKHKSVCN